MGLTRHLDLVKMEGALLRLIPREDWTLVSHLQIAYGRKGSNARTAKRKVVPPTGRFKESFTEKAIGSASEKFHKTKRAGSLRTSAPLET